MPGRHVASATRDTCGQPAASRLRGADRRGQALVEFALVIPIFLAVVVGVIEFAFTFNAILATNLASRDAALVAAEAGNEAGADCAVLRAVDGDLAAPVSRAQIQSVEIFRTTAAGTQVGGATIYVRSGSTACAIPGGGTESIPYSKTQDGYPSAGRCNILAGCGGRPLDHVGVRVTYRHTWRTPLGATFGPYLDVERGNTMRMEPVL